MAGLRDRKKQEARHRIITAAAALIAEQGLDVTTMEEIAATANVSVGTVYNYFGTKSALLLAGIQEDTDLMLEAGRAVLDDPDPDPLTAIKRLSHIYLDELTSWDRRLLREVMIAAVESMGGGELSAELARQDQRLIEQMAQLLAHYHDQGKLAQQVDPLEAVMVLFAVFALQLFMFLSFAPNQISDLHTQIDRQLELVFTGIAKANSE